MEFDDIQLKDKKKNREVIAHVTKHTTNIIVLS